jgi:hypothetical protein
MGRGEEFAALSILSIVACSFERKECGLEASSDVGKR